MRPKENIPEENPLIPRKNPYAVPDRYFDRFPDRMQQRLSESTAPSLSRDYPVRRALALAAMFIGLVTIGYFGLRMILNPRDASVLSRDELDTAIEYFGYEFDDEMLVAAMVESDIDIWTQEPDSETDLIIEYLSDEDIDLSEILMDY